VKQQRIVIGLIWVASLVLVYFVGGIAASTQRADVLHRGNEVAVADAGADSSKEGGMLDRKMDERSGNEAGIREKMAALVARARLESGNSLGGMDTLAMVRTLAPFAALDAAQIAAALSEVERTVRDPGQRWMFYSVLLGQQAEANGKAALDYVDQKLGEKTSFNAEIRDMVIAYWARQDPEAAWRWYQTGRKEQDGAQALQNILGCMAIRDIDSALLHLSTLDEDGQSKVLQAIGGGATTDAARSRLIGRSASLPPEQRAPLLQSMANGWASTAPDEAATWIRSLPAEEQKGLWQQAGQRMIITKPELGAEFLISYADEKQKPQLYVGIAYEWGRRDPRAAGEWLMKQPQGPELDGARQTYAYAVVKKDPVIAMEWANSVQGETQRPRAVEQIFQEWRVKDAAAAEAGLAATRLAPDIIQKIKQSNAPQKGSPGSIFGL